MWLAEAGSVYKLGQKVSAWLFQTGSNNGVILVLDLELHAA